MGKPDKKTLLAQKTRARLASLYIQQLQTILLVVALYYMVLSASHLIFLPVEAQIYIIPLSLVTVAMSLVLRRFPRARRDRVRIGHALFIPVGLLILANIYAHLFLVGDQINLTNGALALVAFAFATYSRRIFGLLFVLSMLLYCAGLIMLEGPYTAHFAFMMFASVLLSALTFLQKRRVVYDRLEQENRLAQFTRQLRKKGQELTEKAVTAEKAHKTMEVFLASTSHELRTPVTGIKGALDLMQVSELDENQSSLVQSALLSTDNLLRLLNDILDISKIQAGNMEIMPEPFNPTELTRSLYHMMKHSADAKGLVFDVDWPDNHQDQWLMGDSGRISQILYNFVGNAIKFTDRGSVTLRLSLAPAETDNEAFMMSVAVKDTGIGIMVDDFAKIFNKFQQLDGDKEKKQGGVGLGLAISHQLAKLMAGKIHVMSDVGKGSEFTFTVTLPSATPLQKPDKQEKDLKAPAKSDKSAVVIDTASDTASDTVLDTGQNDISTETTATQTGKNATKEHTAVDQTVLIVEDNPINQMLVKKMLAVQPYQIDLVENGKEVLAYLENTANPPAVILMDIQMPVMNGVEATIAIRKMAEPFASLPIVALTANAMEEDQKIYLAAGINTVICKPIDRDLLLSTIDEYVQAAMA